MSDHPAVTRRGPGGLALPPRLSRSLCLHPHTYPGSATADSVSQVRGLCPLRSGTVRQTLLPSPLSTRPGLFSPQMQVQKVFDLKEAESSGPRGMLWPCGLPAGRMTSVSGWGLGKDPSSPGRSPSLSSRPRQCPSFTSAGCLRSLPDCSQSVYLPPLFTHLPLLCTTIC